MGQNPVNLRLRLIYAVLEMLASDLCKTLIAFFYTLISLCKPVTLKLMYMKQIRIRLLNNDEITISVNYRQTLQGLIYKLMSFDKDYASDVHDDHGYKLFTFSGLYGTSRYHDKKLTFTGDIKFEIRAVEDYMIDVISESLNKKPYILFGNEILPVHSFTVSSKQIIANKLSIRSDTGITVHTSDEDRTIYYSPDEEAFELMVLRNASVKYMDWKQTDIVPMMGFHPVYVTERDKVVSTFKGTYITAWRGDYELEGTVELLNFLYYCGLGDRNSQGFGMFNLK